MAEIAEAECAAKEVGVLVVTHGDFGEALLGAAQMILGQQSGIQAISVLVSKGVEEIIVALKAALVKLDCGKGVMILTDLFGGTPTTLSLSLLKAGNIEVVSGVNLPMLLKVLQGRGLALPELAVQARDAGQKGIVVPGDMLRKKAAGSYAMFWVRIDNRLIHGQVVEAWVPHVGAKSIIVVNDELAGDLLQQEIMSLAIPRAVESSFVTVEQLVGDAHLGSPQREATLILFSSCLDVRRAVERGLKLTMLNIGNLHYATGKRQISPSVALGADDESCLRYLLEQGVELDFRCVPNDPVPVRFA